MNSMFLANALTGPGVSQITAAKNTLNQQYQEALNRKALAALLGMAGIAAGGGAVIRGLGELRRMSGEEPERKTRAITIDIPVAAKTAAEEASPSALGAVLGNRQARTMWGLPWFWPASTVGLPLAAYGGWKAVDSLLSSSRQAEIDADVEAAKQRFQDAILSQYEEPLVIGGVPKAKKKVKAAATATPVTEALDQLTTKMALGDLKGWTLGAYLALAPVLAAGAFSVGRNYGKKHTEAYALEKARQLREREEAKRRSPEIFARPVDLPPFETETADETLEPVA